MYFYIGLDLSMKQNCTIWIVVIQNQWRESDAVTNGMGSGRTSILTLKM